MRSLVLVLALASAMSTPARAGDLDEEDEAYVPLPKRSIGISGMAHGSRIGGHSESGFGPALELALGRHRWQYFVEASVASTGVNTWTTGALDARVDGRMLHGGLGMRWLARQFRLDESGGIELFLSSLLGLQRFYYEDGGRLTRPELALGFGMQVRGYKRPRFAFRIDARVLFTPNDAESSLVACRGTCMTEAGSTTGFMTGFGIAW